MKHYFRLLVFALIVGYFGPLFAQYDLSICAIFRNEGLFLKEWLEFHKLQGVEHFYLYDNNSSDAFRSVLRPYIENGEVTLIEWQKSYEAKERAKWLAIQTGANMHCVTTYGSQTKWLAVIDIDEFLFCPDGRKLFQFLERYSHFPALGVSWLMFGTSDVEEIPDGKLLIECLTRCADRKNAENHFYKSIVQPRFVQSCPNPHYFLYQNNCLAVDAKMGRLQPDMYTMRVLLDEIRINHYYTRSCRYLREVKLASVKKRFNGEEIQGQMRNVSSYNETSDHAILRFVPALQKAMNIK